MEQERIIVLRKFDGLIEANITKTKLDAFGIPCFLTEEHLTHLTTSFLSGGIRLHLFASDKEQAEHVLRQDFVAKSEDTGLVQCPECNSKRIFTNDDDHDYTKITQIVFSLLMGLTKPYYCQNCGFEFHD